MDTTNSSATINSEECCDTVLSIKEHLEDLQKEGETLHLEISRLRAVGGEILHSLELFLPLTTYDIKTLQELTCAEFRLPGGITSCW